MNIDFLKNNIRSILALMTTFVCLGILAYATLKNQSENVITTSATNILMFVFGYYFSASKDKPQV